MTAHLDRMIHCSGFAMMQRHGGHNDLQLGRKILFCKVAELEHLGN
jgi:hypothetical protein